MKKQKRIIVIVGKGAFGDLMANFLRPHFVVRFVRRSDDDIDIDKKIKGASAIVYSVPMVGLEKSIERTKAFVKPEMVIVDVTSVKIVPLQLLGKHFPGNEILGTHPIFGPQSVKGNGGSLRGLPLVLCQETCSNKTYAVAKQFCKDELGCKIIEQTPQQHDHEMAHVQGLAHFVGRALKHLDIKHYATATKSYEQLLELRDLLQDDSWELFETIQNTNPEAKVVRKQLMDQLNDLESKLI